MTEQLASAKAVSSTELADVKAAFEREKARADAAARELAAATEQLLVARAGAAAHASEIRTALDSEKEQADAAQRELETAQQQIGVRQRGAGNVGLAEQPGSIGRSGQAPAGQFAARSQEAARILNAAVAPSGDAGELNLASLPPGPERRLIERAAALIKDRDISAARLLLERAAQSGNRIALFMLAQTHDAKLLSEWRVVGLAGDQARAEELYRRASEPVSAPSR
jgi:hypothetical protein